MIGCEPIWKPDLWIANWQLSHWSPCFPIPHIKSVQWAQNVGCFQSFLCKHRIRVVKVFGEFFFRHIIRWFGQWKLSLKKHIRNLWPLASCICLHSTFIGFHNDAIWMAPHKTEVSKTFLAQVAFVEMLLPQVFFSDSWFHLSWKK